MSTWGSASAPAHRLISNRQAYCPLLGNTRLARFDIRNVRGSAIAPAHRTSNKQAHCPLLGNTPLACISLRNVNLRQYTQSSQGRVGAQNLYPSSQQCSSRSCMRLGQCSLVQLYILTAGSRSALLSSLHRCRSHQRRSQEASWKLMMMHQSGRPNMGDGASRSPPHFCQRSLTL